MAIEQQSRRVVRDVDGAPVAVEETARTLDTPPPAAAPAPLTDVEQVDVVADDPYAPHRVAADRLAQAVYLIFGVIEALLIIRFALKALGANANAGFSSFIYNITRPLLAPFAGMFGTPQSGGSVLEIHTLVAIVVYALLAWLIGRLVWLAFGDTRTGLRASRRSIDTRLR